MVLLRRRGLRGEIVQEGEALIALGQRDEEITAWMRA